MVGHAHDRITITLCSGAGPVESILDLATGQVLDKQAAALADLQHADKDGDKSACGFAALAFAAQAPEGVALPVRFVDCAQPAATPIAARPQLIPTGPPPARGPPNLI
jgi:hypothetical protein